MHSPTQMIIRDTDEQKLWLVASHKKAAVEASNQALNSPLDYDPLLFGCNFKDAEPGGKFQFIHITDPDGKVISTGSNKEQACWYARRVRFSAINTPGNYYPALAHCSFGIESKNGIAYRTVTMPEGTPEKPNSVFVLSRGSDKESAAKLANMLLIRNKPLSSLKPDEFAHLCVVITLENGRARAKKNQLTQNGPWRLGTHSLLPNSESLALRQAIVYDATSHDIEIHKRVQWCEEKFNSILNTDLSEVAGGVKHLELEGPLFVILRTPDSKPEQDCIQTVWNSVMNPPQLTELADQNEREEDSVVEIERQR